VSEPYTTTQPLTLGSGGELPAGVTLYNYGGPDELPYFVLFVGTKPLDTLKPHKPKHWLEISPTEAW